MHTTNKYNRIKVELAEAGKLSAELAVYLSVHPSTVSDWCTNTNQPSIKDLYRIAEFLDIDVRKLLVPNAVKASSYNLETGTSHHMAAEPEATYQNKAKSSGTTGKHKKKKKKGR